MSRQGSALNKQEIKHEVAKLIGQAFVDIASFGTLDEENAPKDTAAGKAYELNPTFLNFSGGAHGSMFHLAAIAYYNLSPNHTIAHIETRRIVPVYDDAKSVKEGYKKAKGVYQRYVDIILEGDGMSEGERWVELKSLQRYKVKQDVSAIDGDGLKTFGSRPIKKLLKSNLSAKYKRSFYSRQFHVDRVAAKRGAYSGTLKRLGIKDSELESIEVDKSFAWRFHGFNFKRDGRTIKNPPLGEVDDKKRSIRERLTSISKSTQTFNAAILDATLGIDTKTGKDIVDRRIIGKNIQLLSPQSVLINLLKSSVDLEKEIEEAITGIVAP